MIMEATIVSYHSVNRAMERGRVKNARSAEKRIATALQRGKRASEYSSWERSYLMSRDSGCTAIAYNNFCYLVNENGKCMTLYPLPVWFGKKKRFQGKERIRDMKKYQRYCSHETSEEYER